jgi:hypothetical protein
VDETFHGVLPIVNGADTGGAGSDVADGTRDAVGFRGPLTDTAGVATEQADCSMMIEGNAWDTNG